MTTPTTYSGTTDSNGRRYCVNCGQPDTAHDQRTLHCPSCPDCGDAGYPCYYCGR